MRSFKEYKENNSNKMESISELINAIKNWSDKYSLPTRTFVWNQLTSEKGQELIKKILKNPKTFYTKSEFTKLVEKKLGK